MTASQASVGTVEFDSIDAKAALDKIVAQVEQVVLGKNRTVRQALACLIAGGHLLIEDLPGVGKTTLAHALAQSLGLHFKRIQFTSDMLPADILGVSIFEQQSGGFSFHPGPIFAQLVLADEVNRATPKTQSALLEAMEEQNVTVEGETRALPHPFFVIATQNPTHQIGTYPLPESQLDRFLMRISVGYPSAQAERALLQGRDRRQILAEIKADNATKILVKLQATVNKVHASDDLLNYLQAILDFSRQSEHYVCGLSPRAGLALLQAAKAWAVLDGRSHVIPEDIQAVLPSVVAHRLRSATDSIEPHAVDIVQALMDIAIP